MARHFLFAGASASALIMATALPASAQVAAPEPEAGEIDAPTGELEEIVVTAQRREERLQDVPVAVTALTSATLDAAAVTTTDALAATVPGLLVNRSAGAGVPVIRGVGSTNVVLGDESSVATYVDGVYRPFRAGNVFALNNVQRVEVLKGPQGALFGRNATGGVIQVITRTPAQETSYDFAAGYGSYDTFMVNGYVSGGLTSNISADLAVYYNNQTDGWGTNVSTGQDAYYSKELAARSKLLWTPSSDTQITLGLDYGDYTISAPYRILPGSAALDGTTTPADFYDVRATYEPKQRSEQFVASVTAEHSFDRVNLRSISSFQKFGGEFNPDNDVTPLPILNAFLDPVGKAYTQELQLSSAPDDGIGWIVGGFFMFNRAGNESVLLSGSAIQGGGLQFLDTRAIQETTSYSAFGQVTVPITSQIQVTGGLRYTHDRQHLEFDINSDLGPLGSGTSSESFSKLSPRAVVEFEPGEDVLIYASYNSGFKSGLFNTIEPTRPVVRPETLNAYEIGLKSQLANRRVRFNVAGFYYDYTNLQVLQVVAASTVLLNAGSVKSYGVDADLEWALTDALTIRGGMALLHAKYKDFDNAPISSPNFPAPGVTIVPGSVSDNDVARAPKRQFILGARYNFSEAFDAAVNVAHTGSFFWEPDNRLRQDSVNMLSATLNWSFADDRFGVQLWGRNLLNEKYNAFETALPFGDIGQAAAPLTFGITLKVRN